LCDDIYTHIDENTIKRQTHIYTCQVWYKGGKNLPHVNKVNTSLTALMQTTRDARSRIRSHANHRHQPGKGQYSSKHKHSFQMFPGTKRRFRRGAWFTRQFSTGIHDRALKRPRLETNKCWLVTRRKSSPICQSTVCYTAKS